MLFVRAGQTLLLVATLALSPAFASRIHRAPTAGHAKAAHARHGRRLHLRLRKSHGERSYGQRTIDPERATEIQQALIRENYLSGSPSGQWDAQTQAAMQKYQADHGWQTKLMPDSRALISLGLGPSRPADLPLAKASINPAAPQQPADPAANTLASVHSISQ